MPAIARTFRTEEPSLKETLELIDKGKIQLPDFQRGWVWDDLHIRSLIASVSLAYPIGAVMMLEVAPDGSTENGIRFKPRTVEGAPNPPESKPERLILDGQQRLTSLYRALFSGKPVLTRTDKGKEIERVYYLDMAKCLESKDDRLDAVLSIPADKMVRSDFNRAIDLDLSTSEHEYKNQLFPLSIAFDSTATLQWLAGYSQFFGFDKGRIALFYSFNEDTLQALASYKLSQITLLKETHRVAVCQVFELVNTGGVSLTVFELLTANFAVDNFDLRHDWQGNEDEDVEGRRGRLWKHRQLSDLAASDFLTALTLLASYERFQADGKSAVSCKRKDVLKLTSAVYRQYADRLEKAFVNVARFLDRQSVYRAYDLPYQTQLIPLAVMLAVLGDRYEQDAVRQKLAQWYWCGVFGEMYGGANEARYAFDVPEMIDWINGADVLPRTIRDSNFAPLRLLSLQSRLSAAYKGIHALLMQSGAQDFISGDPMNHSTFFDLDVDIHHVFPQAYCQKQGYKKTMWNSVVNKTPLSGRSNKSIGGREPSVYLKTLIAKGSISEDRLDAILASHRLDPALLRVNDFHGFMRDRAIRLLDMIEGATGKKVQGRDGEDVVEAFGIALIAPVPVEHTQGADTP